MAQPCKIDRRDMIGLAAAGTMSNALFRANVLASENAPAIKVLDTREISRTPHLYCGWPTLTRTTEGRLLVVYSGGREAHVCPFGRVEIIQSDDDGKTWTWPRTLLDSAIDDRDAGILETAKGTLLVTTFSSLAYDDYALRAAVQKTPGAPGAWSTEKLDRWMAVHQRLSPQQRKAELGQWMLRSTDGGITWSKRYGSIVNSPHGPIQLKDGRLLYAGVALWSQPRRVGVCESTDDGKSWSYLADIPAMDGHASTKDYHELHAVETASGKLIVHIRNHANPYRSETLQSESVDGGQSWSKPRTIGVWGLPSFLLRLKDGRLLMTYGHRRAPFGIQARISDDDAASWSAPMTLSADGAGGDLGYPSTVELESGSLVTIWYEKLKAAPKAVLRQCRWRLD